MAIKEVHVAAGSPSSRRSTVWKFAVHANEIYIFSRMFGADVKVSLHSSGDCQFSRTTRWVTAQPGRKNADRHIEKWHVTPPVGQVSFHIYRIQIPETELREITAEEDLSEVDWIPPPGPGQTLSLECYLTPPSAHDPTLTANLPLPVLFAVPRSDARWLVVLRYDAPLDGRALTELRRIQRTIARRAGIVATSDHRTATLTGAGREARGLIELAPF